jgi:YVTN family beta-propeller protein
MHQEFLGRVALGAMVLGLSAGLAFAEPAIDRSVKVAPGLYELAVSPSTRTVYVASAGRRGENDAKVVAVDAATLEVKGEIDVSGSPVFGLGINDRTQTLYGTATRDGSVVVIDLKAGKVSHTVKRGEKAHVREAVVDEDGNRVFISVFGNRARPAPAQAPAAAGAPPAAAPAAEQADERGEIWILDGMTGQIAEVIEKVGKGIGGIVHDAKANRLYATAMTTHEVLAIDLSTKQVVANWPTGGDSPMNLAMDPERGHLFVANQKSGNVTVLDTKDGAVLKTVKTGAGALSVAYDAKTGQVFVSNRGEGTLSVIDAESYEVVTQLPTGTLPQTVGVDRETGLVYVSNKARGTPRDAPKDAPPVEDPNGDTLSLIRP